MKFEIIRQYMIKEQNTERTDDKVIAEFDDIEYAWEYCQLKKKETCCLFYFIFHLVAEHCSVNSE